MAYAEFDCLAVANNAAPPANVISHTMAAPAGKSNQADGKGMRESALLSEPQGKGEQQGAEYGY